LAVDTLKKVSYHLANVIKLRKSEEFYVCKSIRLFFSAINYKKLDIVVKKCGEAL